MKRHSIIAVAAIAAVVSLTQSGQAGGPAVRSEDGKYFDKDDNITYNVKADGTVDWYTYSGFRRYHSECHVCHGPDGEGSSIAPGLKESLKTMSYLDFFEVVVNGREVKTAGNTSKMPSLGLNRNVMCYLDDIYAYIKARSDEAVPRGRPRKKEAKPQVARDDENACLDG